MGNTQEEILERYAAWLKVKRDNSESTVKLCINLISRFFRWLNERRIDVEKINQRIVDDYLLYCNNKYSRNFLVAITITLRKFCIFLGKDIEVKIVHPKAPNRDKMPLTEKEVEAMFKAAEDNPLEYAILKTLYYSGIRQQELRNLDIDDIDFDRLQIIVKHGKGDRYRVVNITKDCAEAIKRWLVVRPKPKEGHEKALFISIYRTRVGSTYVWSIVKRKAAEVGINKNVYPHKFRITMISRMAEAGLSPKEIQAQSGHRDIGTLMGYIQHSPERIRSSYERVFEKGVISKPKQDLRRESIPQISNEYYKEMAIKKYLNNEIDADTLHSILANIENNTNNTRKRVSIDPSYQ